jgi:hypothetical protein
VNTITIGVVALAIAGGILVIRNRRRSRSLDEASIEGVAKMNGASTLTSQADAEQPAATTLSKSAQSADATESTSEVSTETDDKTD